MAQIIPLRATGDGIKPDTWYRLNDGGKPMECEP